MRREMVDSLNKVFISIIMSRQYTIADKNREFY